MSPAWPPPPILQLQATYPIHTFTTQFLHCTKRVTTLPFRRFPGPVQKHLCLKPLLLRTGFGTAFNHLGKESYTFGMFKGFGGANDCGAAEDKKHKFQTKPPFQRRHGNERGREREREPETKRKIRKERKQEQKKASSQWHELDRC